MVVVVLLAVLGALVWIGDTDQVQPRRPSESHAATERVATAETESVPRRPRESARRVRSTEEDERDSTAERERRTEVRHLLLRILGDEVPTPPDGTELTVAPAIREPTHLADLKARVEGDHVVLSDVPPGLVALRLLVPGGVARLRFTTHGPLPEVRFRPLRSLTVTVTTASGGVVRGWIAPAEGAGDPGAARPLFDGDHPPEPAFAAQPRSLADSASATWDALVPTELAIWYGTDETLGSVRRLLGTVDLREGDRAVTFELPPHRLHELQFDVDGRPGHPEQLHVHGPVQIAHSDPETGRMTLRVFDDTPEPVQVRVFAGLESNRRVDLARSPDGSPQRVSLTGERSVQARVVPPVEIEPKLSFERWVGARWTRDLDADGMVVAVGLRPDADGRVWLDRAPPGRYRLVDAVTGATTAGGELEPGRALDLGVLDLSGAFRVRGTFDVPAGLDPADAWVELVPPEGVVVRDPVRHRVARSNLATHFPDSDGGSFQVVVPAPGTTLVAAHEELVPAPSGGRIVVRSPDDRPRLRLVEGAQLVLRTGELDLPPGSARPRVLFFEDDPRGRPLFDRRPKPRAGSLRMVAPPAGRHTLWIDLQRGAPVVLRDVEIFDGVTTLPPIQPPAGLMARIRVELDGSDELHADRGLRVIRVASDDAPGYLRWGRRVSGENAYEVSGLLPGRHVVQTISLRESLRMSPFEFDVEPGMDEVVWRVR